MQKNKEIPIFFTIDDNYAPFLAVALHSAIVNSDPTRTYRALVLHQGLSEKNTARLQALAKPHFAVELVPMRANFDALDDRMSNRLRCDYFTLTIYFRLFIPTMFPSYDKAIYIDSDVVLKTDIAKLYDIPLGENELVGACRDLSIADIPPLVAYTERAVGVGRDEYVNSGVLLMNLDAMRACDLEGHFLRLLNTYHFDSIAPDQDYLNAMCNGKIHYLDERWDTMPNESRPQLDDPYLIHYNLFSKPWCYDGVQYEDDFWHYAKGSGYERELRAHKAAYTDEQKRADADCLALLVRRGEEIAESEVTFRRMLEAGEQIRL